MIETQEAKTRDIPIWLTALVMLLCIGGGAWLIRWYMKDHGSQVVDVPLDHAQAAAARNYKGPLAGFRAGGAGRALDDMMSGPVDGVRASGNRGNAWIVRSGKATMYVSLDRKGELDVNPSYVKQELTDEQQQMLLLRRRLLTDTALRGQLQVSDEQVAKLKKVADFRGMVIDAAERARLSQLFDAWRKAAAANRAQAEKALVAGLAEVATKAAEPTKAFDAKRVAEVKAVLTPDQLKAFQSGTAVPQK
jgi:hypothetical protein